MWRWENHLTQVLSTKPVEVVQEACQVLEKHGCPVKELKSELYHSSTLCQVVFRLLHYANLIVALTAWTALMWISTICLRIHCVGDRHCPCLCVHTHTHARTHTHTHTHMHTHTAHMHTHTHTHTHTCTHTHTHAHTHMHTHTHTHMRARSHTHTHTSSSLLFVKDGGQVSG